MTKSRLLLLLAGLLVLGAWQGAVCSRAFAEDGAPPAKSDDKGKADAAKDSGKGKAGADVTGGRFAGDPIYVHIPPLVMPIITDEGLEQLVDILLIVQVKDSDAATDLHNNMPRVMDSLMRHLYGGLGQGSLRNGKLVNVNKVKNKALSAVSEVAGPENIIDVLVQGVSQRVL